MAYEKNNGIHQGSTHQSLLVRGPCVDPWYLGYRIPVKVGKSDVKYNKKLSLDYYQNPQQAWKLFPECGQIACNRSREMDFSLKSSSGLV